MTEATIVLHKVKHLLSHVLVVAGVRRWPQITLGDSGETSTGFYADFGLVGAPDETELAALNDEMARVLRDACTFRDLQLTPRDAASVFTGQPWKKRQAEAVAEIDDRVACYELDGVIDICDCALKNLRELREVHPERFLLTSASPVTWSDRGKDFLFIRVTGELFPAPPPCTCCG